MTSLWLTVAAVCLLALWAHDRISTLEAEVRGLKDRVWTVSRYVDRIAGDVQEMRGNR